MGWEHTTGSQPRRRPVSRRRRTGSRLRRLALFLIVLGLVTSAIPFAMFAYGSWQQRQLQEEWEQVMRSQPPDADGAAATPGAIQSAAAAPLPGSRLAFAMRVPRFGYYAVVREGVSGAVLADGPGHYPDTAWPGRPGTVGVAGHNTYWTPFGQLQPGDEVRLETRSGTFRYRVTGSRITNPEDRNALLAAIDRRLVLTTCWPLWAGALAPQRLLIFADQV